MPGLGSKPLTCLLLVAMAAVFGRSLQFRRQLQIDCNGRARGLPRVDAWVLFIPPYIIQLELIQLKLIQLKRSSTCFSQTG